jgi:hypothetical protein
MHSHRLTGAASGITRDRPALVCRVLWVVFAIFRFWQAVISSPGIWQDSKAYEAVSRFPLFSTGFWSGARPPLIPLVLKIASTPRSFVVLQTTISVVVWGFLAFRVGALSQSRDGRPILAFGVGALGQSRGGWRRVIVVGVVLAFACTETVAEWDWSVLSESLALSALASIFAFSIGYARTKKASEAIGLVCAATIFSFARDESIWTVALLGLAALISAGWVAWSSLRRGVSDSAALRPNPTEPKLRARRTQRSGPRTTGCSTRRWARRTAQRTALLGLSLVVVAGFAELAAVDSQRDIPELVDVLAVRIFPFPDRVAWFTDHGMPDGSVINQTAAITPPITTGGAPYVFVDLDSPEFPGLSNWIDSSGPSTYGLWLIENPGYDIAAPFERPTLTYNDANGNLGFYAAPNRTGTSGLDTVLFPGLLGELVLIAIGLLFVFRRRLIRLIRSPGSPGSAASTRSAALAASPGSPPSPASPRSASRITPVLITLAILGALGPISMLVAWQGESQEVTRHMVEGSVEIRLAVLLFLLVAAFGRTTQTPAPTELAASAESPNPAGSPNPAASADSPSPAPQSSAPMGAAV